MAVAIFEKRCVFPVVIEQQCIDVDDSKDGCYPASAIRLLITLYRVSPCGREYIRR
jgi:hypothetical protein